MTALYRVTGAECPDFESRTLWTMNAESAEWQAAYEAAAGDRPASSRVYRAEVTMGDDLYELNASDVIPRVRDGSLDANGLSDWTQERAPVGCRWVQFTDHGRSWKGAVLYLGDEPVPAEPAGQSQD